MNKFTVLINEDTTATVITDLGEYTLIGMEITATAKDENGNPEEVTGVVTEVLESESL